MKRKTVVVHILAVIAAWFGAWVVLPTIGSTVAALPQMALTEFPWIPAIFGAAVTLWAWRKPRMSIAIALSLIGVVLAIQPILQSFGLGGQLDAAMRFGLGDNYADAIPETARMASARFSLLDAVGARNFGSRATVTENVEFFAAPERALMLDVYQPQVEPALGDSYPAVIVIHGGSWRWMDKSGVFSVHDRYLASLGYVVFDIQYRLSPEAIWNAQLQDVQCAVAWVRANAEQYRVDTARIALMGRSAGAHLALEAAYRPNDATVDLAACGMAGVDTSVSAVVAFYPPTDLRMWDSTPDGALAALLGGLPADMPEVYADASPTEFVRDDLPPTLLLQGYMDDLVVPAHVELLHNLLLATNTPVVVLRVPWGRHGFDFLIGGLGAQMVEYDIDRFLAWSFYRID